MTVASTTIDASVLRGRLPDWEIRYFQYLSDARIAEFLKEYGKANQLRERAEKLKEENETPLEFCERKTSLREYAEMTDPEFIKAFIKAQEDRPIERPTHEDEYLKELSPKQIHHG